MTTEFNQHNLKYDLGIQNIHNAVFPLRLIAPRQHYLLSHQLIAI